MGLPGQTAAPLPPRDVIRQSTAGPVRRVDGRYRALPLAGGWTAFGFPSAERAARFTAAVAAAAIMTPNDTGAARAQIRAASAAPCAVTDYRGQAGRRSRRAWPNRRAVPRSLAADP